MKLLWVYDHPFFRDAAGVVYSRAVFPYRIWQRYLNHFDSITILSRFRPLAAHESVPKLIRSDGPKVTFVELNDLTRFPRWRQRRQNLEIITGHLATHDALIARLPSANGTLAATTARDLGKPCLIEVVGCPWDSFWNYGNLPGKIIAPVGWWRLRRATASASHALYVTREFLQTRYPSKGQTAHASNVEIPETPQAVLDHRLSRGMGNPVKLGFIGYIGARTKGLQVLLKALADVQGSLPDFRLEVLGNGDPQRWDATLQRLKLTDHVKFLGAYPPVQPVLDWLDTVDLYIHPSFQEGLPRALIEAMSRGCPALASTAGGIPELLDREYLHKPGDHRSLGRQMVELLNSENALPSASRPNFEVATRYNAEILNQRRYEFFAKWIADSFEK